MKIQKATPTFFKNGDTRHGTLKDVFIHPEGKNKHLIRDIFEQSVNQIIDFCSQASGSTPLPNENMVFGKSFLPDQGSAFTELQKELDLFLKQSMNPHHPGYIGHMDSVPAVASIIGDFVAAAINNNMLSKEMSPVFSQMERELLHEIGSLFGLSTSCGGVLTSGGSIANLHALAVARNQAFDVKEKGLCQLSSSPVIFASALAHTSIKKAAMILGLGSNTIVSIPVDESKRMDPSALEKEIAKAKREGKRPFCVVATAGTTVFGSIDPLEKIAELCEANSLWFHIDAAYGGALIFSEKYKNLLKGIERADSLVFNPQKWLYVAKTCAMVLFKDMEKMKDHFTIFAPYMSDIGKGVNSGEFSIQGTRHADILKLYLTLKHIGKKGFEGLIEKQIELLNFFINGLKKIQKIEILTQPQNNIVCFTLKNSSDESITQVANALLKECNIFLSTPSVEGRKVFRCVLLNPFTTSEEIKRCIGYFQNL